MDVKQPLVAEIKRNSLDDGPGIRSVVFFKGCPLSCAWCHNPECIKAAAEIVFRPDPCVGCRSCREVCPEGSIPGAGPAELDRDRCTACGLCADECPSGALTLVGRSYEPEELAETLLLDKDFYDNSGGGVTLSGGEPTLFLDYAAKVAERLHNAGVHVCLETCGRFDRDRVFEKLLPYVDLVYVDIKLVDPALHHKYCGADNSQIFENIERLLSRDELEVLIRVPLVPDVTATTDNLEAIARWLSDHNVDHIALLPYNPLWLTKARGLGKSLEYSREQWMSEQEREKVKNIFRNFKLERDI